MRPCVWARLRGIRSGFLSQFRPFSDAREFYVRYAEEHLRLIADGQLWGRYPIDVYLMFEHLRELALQGKCNPLLEYAGDKGPFYLKHTDDKGDHFLVGDQFNISGIIDWSFARTLPAYDAFGPSLPYRGLGPTSSGAGGTIRTGRAVRKLPLFEIARDKPLYEVATLVGASCSP